MKLVINVTQADIKNGKYQDSEKCVIALALARDLKKYAKVFKFNDFNSETVTLIRKSDGRFFNVAVPKKASSFAERFDAIQEIDLGDKAFGMSDSKYEKELKARQAKARGKLKPFKFTFAIPDEIFQKVEKQEAVSV